MASTRAEALARYARATRVTDVTHLPFDRDGAQCPGDTVLHDLGALAGESVLALRGLLRHAPRAIVLLSATVALTPVLPALIG